MSEATIGENIRRLRKAAGLSQVQLADAMRDRGQTHWRQNTVSRVENGRQPLDLSEFEPLAEILGDFLQGTPEAASLSSAVAFFPPEWMGKGVFTPEFKRSIRRSNRLALPWQIRGGRRELDRISERLESTIEALGSAQDSLQEALADRDKLRERLTLLEKLTTSAAAVEAADHADERDDADG